MKSYSKSFLVLLVSLLTFSCTDSLTDIGSSIQPSSDLISVGVDTFHVSTKSVFIDSIFSRPDSLLLGTFYDTKYGSTRAEILAQVAWPTNNFRFPVDAKPDSALLSLYFNTCFGDKKSPMEVSVYEVNKDSFSYKKKYYSNIDPADYCDKSILLGKRVFSVIDDTETRDDSTFITVKLSDKFVERFFSDEYYNNSNDFINKFFKGIYITSNYGAATMLNVSQINIEYYTHYQYQSGDTMHTVVLPLDFPVTNEVCQVNRFVHPDRSSVNISNEELNYISSPGNIYTRVKVPMNRIVQRMNVSDKKLMINSALLKVEADEVDTTDLAQDMVSSLLLIREDDAKAFFDNKKLPSDTTAILGTLTSALNDSTSEYEYYYSFDMAALVAKELINHPNPTGEMNMMLIPVRVKYDSSSNITDVRPQILMSAITIRSGRNKKSPMRMNVMYSGF